MDTEEKREILNKFLERWPESRVRSMALNNYVGVEDKNTFTYWIETVTRPLGSILGWDSIKFGIYRRAKPEKINKNHQNDNEYTWMARFGADRTEAFATVKQDILDIIRFAENGDFAKIDDLRLPNLFKWKVASLYSNERLVPIFKQEVLFKIADAFGLKTTRDTRISGIHELLISKKPAGQDIYSYEEGLYEKYGIRKDKGRVHTPTLPRDRTTKLITRKPSGPKNLAPQARSGSLPYFAERKHDKIQEALRQRLIQEYGEDKFLIEENWVDGKLFLPEEIVFYEVKSAAYASDCIEEALGQVLGYVFNDKDSRKKRIVVVGQYPPNEDDLRFIKYIKSILNIEFDYQHIEI